MVIPHSYDPAHSCICRKIAETSPVQKTQVQKQARKGSLMLVGCVKGSQRADVDVSAFGLPKAPPKSIYG